MDEGKNRFGLSRSIDSETKRIIRINSGFGCVICGLAIVDYEHVDPEFKDAKEHNPVKMTLLCPYHHAKVTRGSLSKRTVMESMKQPFCLEEGFARETFDTSIAPIIKLGTNIITNCRYILSILGMPILELSLPEIKDGPIRLSGKFFNTSGKLSLEIIENEWHAFANNWDVQVISKTITIRESKSIRHLQLDLNPPDQIEITHLDMLYKGIKVQTKGDDLVITYPNGETRGISKLHIKSFETAINIT